MPAIPTALSWIQHLNQDQLIQQLTERGLDTAGILPILRARLVKYELGEATGSGDTASIPSEELLIGDPGSFQGDDKTSTQDSRRGYRAGTPVREDTAGISRNTRTSAMDAYQMLRKWNIQFSGKRGCDAEAFLTRLKEARAVMPVTDADLFKCLPLVLSDVALYWVRLESNKWRTWGDFETAWRTRFGDPDYHYALREEAMRRTQGEQESAMDYLTCLRSLLSRIEPPWSLSEQLSLAYRNMLPRLQLCIRRHEFFDFNMLEELATRIERTYMAQQNFRPPIAPELSLFPDLAYHPPKSKPKNVVTVGAAVATPSGRGKKEKGKKNRDTDHVTEANVVTGGNRTSDSPTDQVTCWNCQKRGHIARNCTETRKLYCYRCGRKEVTVKTCPTCAENANRSA